MITRRTVLRGLLGGSAFTLGLPLLEPMLNSHGTALAQGIALPKRYGLFFWGGGLPWNFRHKQPARDGNPEPRDIPQPDLWTPTATGKGYELTPLLQPLARHKDNFSVVTGLEPHTDIPIEPRGLGDGHMRGVCVTLTGDQIRPQGFDHDAHILAVNRQTFDQVIAKHPQFYSDGAPLFRSLELGMSKAVLHDYGTWLAVSHSGPDALNIPVRNPQSFFDQVFAVKADFAEVGRRTSVLDVVLEDIRDLQPRLGARDRQRLDEHLTHVSEIERRLKLAQAECVNPAAPTATFGEEKQNMAKLDVMGDMLVAALRCDMTRVFTIAFTTCASVMGINAAGEVDGPGSNNMHAALHEGTYDIATAAAKYHMTAFALLLDKLAKEIDVNGQSLLDSSCVLGTSEYGEGYTHSNKETPVIIAGKAGGTLEPGWHVRDEGGNYSRAHLTVLRALGINEPSFGFNGGQTSDVLPFFKA